MISPQHEPLVICDASPLIVLAKIEQAGLLLTASPHGASVMRWARARAPQR